MKRSVCLLCVFVLILSAMAILVSAKSEFKDSAGMTFNENDKYSVSKSFEVPPLSVETWVCLPKDAGRAGVVIGNYAGSAACVNFEITTNGRPRMYVVEYTSGEKVIHDVTFKNVDVRKGEPVHVAVTHDAARGETYCYVNGELKQTISGALNITNEVLKNAFALGGDLRSGNAQYFKGSIDTVAVYSDARSAEEIKAAMNNVDTADEALIAYYETDSLSSYTIRDKSGNGYDIKRIVTWLETKEPVTDYAYSFCVVGDTQVVTESYPDKLADIYDWIIANKDEKKIEFVFGMGDITNKNTDVEWVTAKKQIERLNGVVPYSIVRGNHDGTDKLNSYMATPEYMSEFDGFYEPNKIDNAWRAFKVADVDYLLINLDFGPSDTLLNWAAGIIEAHPDHRVIITTHCYLYRDGTTLDASDVAPPNKTGSNDGARNNGDQMWDKLVSKYENIFLVLSGHDPCSDVIATQTEGVHGNAVTQMLIDPQGVDSAEGATGMVAMLYFSKDGKTLTVEQYSTVRDMYYMSTSQFELALPEMLSAEEDASDASESESAETNDTTLPDDDEAISIIGGADGPTAVLVSSGFEFEPISFVIGIAVGFIPGIIAVLVMKKKK